MKKNKIVIVFILCFLVNSWLSFVIGYIIGCVSKVLFGNLIITGINMILKTEYIKNDIPLLAGTLSWISMLCKSIQINAE